LGRAILDHRQLLPVHPARQHRQEEMPWCYHAGILADSRAKNTSKASRNGPVKGQQTLILRLFQDTDEF
jgi:hypothetical protein